MIEIKLEIAQNGVIKNVADNNYNGAGSSKESRTVYETDGDKKKLYTNTMKFFYELADDLGIDLGNKFDKDVFEFKTTWGSHYQPTLDEVRLCIKDYKDEVKYLKELEKSIVDGINADKLMDTLKK